MFIVSIRIEVSECTLIGKLMRWSKVTCTQNDNSRASNALYFICFVSFSDMIAATSVLQQQAGDIRQNRINWQSYMQSQMITNEDYLCVSALDSDQRGEYMKHNQSQCAKTFLNLLSHVSKDQTIQYILVMIDDILQEDRTRVEIFHEYAARRKESVWGPFLNLLNRQDGFIVNMSSRILAKLACWGHEQMPSADLNFYFQWLKDQLTTKVSPIR